MTATHALAEALGVKVTDWLDTDEHRDQAWNLHRLIADQDGPYVASAWLIGMNPHLNDDSPLNAIRNGHSADARAAAYAQISGAHAN
ncbi:hypothetical protein OG301_39050 (plasmid) [Streptomyces platensis]|uniref:hypothetical protein n=1 Tax=Streptomyces platensis TaxID=58346 RepID=UPI002ED646C8|nr:hypothetical protein OG301_39050 [Streptomyces platensis]